MFVLGDPKHRGKKHHGANRVPVMSETDMIALVVTSGHSLRVWTGAADNMVRLNLFVDGVRVT